MLGDQLTDGGYQVVWDFHHGLIPALESRLVLRDRLIFGLLFLVGEDFSHPFSIPPRWELRLAHLSTVY